MRIIGKSKPPKMHISIPEKRKTKNGEMAPDIRL